MDDEMITVRRVTEVAPEMVEACGRLLPQLVETFAGPSEELLRKIVGSDHMALFAAEKEGRTIGVLTFVWYDLPSYRKSWIEDVVVDEAARGAGAGMKLVEAALELAKEIGAARVMLTSNPRRKAAHALYRKAGFEVLETNVFVRLIT